MTNLLRFAAVFALLAVAACAADDAVAPAPAEEPSDRPPAYFEPVGTAKTWRQISGRCGIQQDGTLWCWGHKAGQRAFTPVKMSADADWSAVSARDEACAIKEDGQAWCWQLPSPELADVEEIKQLAPEPVSNAVPFEYVSTGSFHSCFVGENDRLYCRGALSYDLGSRVESDDVVYTGTESTVVDFAYEPLEMDGNAWASPAAALSGAYPSLSCALRGGDAYCWTGTPNTGTGFELVSGGKSFEKLRAGSSLACGLDSAGEVWCWDDTLSPASVGQGFTDFDTDGAMGCGIKADGTLWCWGTVPGNGKLYSSRDAGARGKAFTGVSVGLGIVCGLVEDGSVVCLDLPRSYGIFDVRTTLDEPKQVDGAAEDEAPKCDLLVCQPE